MPDETKPVVRYIADTCCPTRLAAVVVEPAPKPADKR